MSQNFDLDPGYFFYVMYNYLRFMSKLFNKDLNLKK